MQVKARRAHWWAAAAWFVLSTQDDAWSHAPISVPTFCPPHSHVSHPIEIIIVHGLPSHAR